MAAVLAALIVSPAVRAQSAPGNYLIIDVKDARTKKPIFQARLTLQFNEHGGKLRKHGLIAYSAKTNLKGRYRFTGIPFGTLRLIVTAPDHQTWSEEFQFTKNNQVVRLKLKPPHPLV
jgi:Carboxypeptidase regulatory-like domain